MCANRENTDGECNPGPPTLAERPVLRAFPVRALCLHAYASSAQRAKTQTGSVDFGWLDQMDIEGPFFRLDSKSNRDGILPGHERLEPDQHL